MQFIKNILGSLWILLLLPSEIKGQCTKPPASDNAVVHEDYILKDTFEEESTIRLRCYPGYQPSSGLSRLTCSSGQWSPSPESFICRKKSCGNPGEVTNGEYQFPDGIEFGAEIIAVCNIGFQIIGENKRTCQANGEWNGREAVCEAVTCPPPPPVTNGDLKLPSEEYYNFGDVVQYMCSNGYSLFGENNVHCLVHGNWSEKPRCTKVDCPRPDIPNAKRIEGHSGPYTLRNRLVYECVKGYRMMTPNNQMVCLEEGWSHKLTCEEVECPQPGASNAIIIAGAGGPYRYGSFVRYECQIGHRLVGSSQLECGSDGQWSSNPPMCEEVKCPQPRVTNATITEGAGGSYGYGTVVGYKCPAEQKLVGSPQLKCESNGQWSSNPPVCLKESTPPPFLNLTAVVLPPVLFFVAGGLIWIFIRYKKKKKNRSSPTPSHSESVQLKSLNTPENGV